MVPMTGSLRRELEDARKAAQTPYVVELAGKRALDVKKGFSGAVKSDLEDVTPHDLRHTTAVWIAEDGVSMAEIAQFLRPSDEGVTFRICAILPEPSSERDVIFGVLGNMNL